MVNEHGLHFDLNHVKLALRYLETRDESTLRRLIDSPATTHLLAHARHYSSGMPSGSAEELTRSLIEPVQEKAGLVETVWRAVTDAEELIRGADSWIFHATSLLPGSFCFSGSLFFTFGYDIGVSCGPNASINLAHPCFRETRDELVVYCVHELHHAGFSAYQSAPDFGRIETRSDLAAIVDFCAHLEGIAVLAAMGPRLERNITVDYLGDYEALADSQRMAGLIRRFFELRQRLAVRVGEPCDDADFGIIDEMSSGERLWYRVGCHMGQTIAEHYGRDRLAGLIEKGPESFFRAFSAIDPRLGRL